MNLATAVVVTIAIIAFAVMRIVRYQTQHDRRALSAPPDDGTKAQLKREVEELRERVRVLERIATDSNSTNAVESRKIAQEIEALRDRQA
jgi:hypothetical protein